MSDLQIGIASFPALLLVIFLRVPVGLAMLAVGLGGMYLLDGSMTVSLSQFKHLTYGTFSSYSLSIVPLFLLMGQLATLGGLSTSLFRSAESWLGHRKGGLAMSAIGACAGFGSICGSSLATAATMSQVALPELRKAGYSGSLATGTLAAGGTLGILIPPSIILVIYAILTEQNVAKLFAAALIPGIFAAVSYMVTISLSAHFLSVPLFVDPHDLHSFADPHHLAGGQFSQQFSRLEIVVGPGPQLGRLHGGRPAADPDRLFPHLRHPGLDRAGVLVHAGQRLAGAEGSAGAHRRHHRDDLHHHHSHHLRTMINWIIIVNNM